MKKMISLICLISQIAAAKPQTFDGAKWIWHPEAGNAAGTWYFQKSFDFPAGQKPKQAKLIITCDNLWTLHINGKKVGQNDSGPDSWMRPQVLDVSKNLVIEQNAIAIEGVNTIPGPSGLIMKLQVTFEDGKKYELTTDKSWISTTKPEKSWIQNGFIAGSNWTPAEVRGNYGMKPWGKVAFNQAKPATAKPIHEGKAYPKETEFKDAIFKDGIVYVGNNMPLTVASRDVYVQFIRRTRAYFEMDPMTPAAIGGELWSLVPFRPDGKKTLLYKVKQGGKLGSPSVSYDGKTVYFALAKAGEAYFHVYAINPDGTNLRQITDGPFHDYDPVELPDGRIAFSSTRIGNREEYHAKYASSLFTLDPKTRKIRPLTYHIVADREPRVMADGSLTFVRTDNFLERAKVEVHLHQTRIDGTAGQVIIGPGRKGVRIDRDAAAEHPMNWLRKYGAGSPAPLPNGTVAAINQKGLVTSETATGTPIGGRFLPYDISPLPGGRLLCTSIHKNKILIFDPKDNGVKEVANAAELGVRNLHSVVHLGKRKKPMMMPSLIDPKVERSIDKTGYLYCQNVLNTQHSSADLKRIKAVRVYEGKPFTLEPTKTIYSHIGTVAVELGTVPIMDDGSFYVEVPADRPLAMQAVDGEGRAVINELSWIYTRPGEQRSCVGCHAPADAAPQMARSKALQARPLKLLGQGDPHRFRANNGANGGIVNLQLDRFREAAAINLYDIPDDDSLSTIRRLGILRDRKSVPKLIKALKSDEVEKRVAAALSLSACGNRDAVKPLMNALSDNNPIVRQAVKNALEHLTGSTGSLQAGSTGSLQTADPKAPIDWDAIEKKLIEQIKSQDQQEVHLAIEALGHVGGEAGADAIADYLVKNPNGELRILMAALRSLGHINDWKGAYPLLTNLMKDNLTKKGKGGFHETGFGQKPIYLCATAAEAWGRKGCSTELVMLFLGLNPFDDYVFRTAEHSWLKGVHSSVVHFRMLEAMERMESESKEKVTSKIIESLPADKDRGLLYELDTYEKLSASLINRGEDSDDVIEACFAVLSEEAREAAGPPEALINAVSKAPHAEKHIRRHSPQARAAQVLSICARDKDAHRIKKLLEKYRADKPSETRSWVCFMLTRTLGRLGDENSIDLLIDIIENEPTEAALGLNPPPTHIIYKGWRPFYRPAVAWSLGEIKAKKAVPVLMKVVQDLDNASSTREQAAVALGKIADKESLKQLKEIAEEYPELMTRRAILEAVKK